MKVPQWYSVQEGDATMFIQGSTAWTKNINCKLPVITGRGCTLNCEGKEVLIV